MFAVAHAIVADRKAMGFSVHVQDKFRELLGQVLEVADVFIQGREEMISLMFVIFGERDDRDRDVQLVQGLQHGVQLSFATIDENQIGELPFRMGHAAHDDFSEHSSVVGAGDGFDIELSVFLVVSSAVGEDDHRASGVLALDIGDVIAFDAARNTHQSQLGFHLF